MARFLKTGNTKYEWQPKASEDLLDPLWCNHNLEMFSKVIMHFFFEFGFILLTISVMLLDEIRFSFLLLPPSFFTHIF